MSPVLNMSAWLQLQDKVREALFQTRQATVEQALGRHASVTERLREIQEALVAAEAELQ